ncbi:MAG TPA: hypothetical protein VF650_11195 [Allosphingosinicella sp.]|jgi:hypothetical protein
MIAPDNAPAAARQPGQLALLALPFLLLAYLASPALTSAHVEGFSAQTQSLALALSEGWRADHDLDLPLISQYIYTTRPGVISILAAMGSLFGSSDLNYRLLTLASLAVFLLASCLFARRWGRVPYSFMLLALLLTPGVLAIGFYFNDTIVSTALGLAALAVVGPRSRPSVFALSGVLMAAATLCRVDAVLLLPLIGLLAPVQRSTLRHVALAALFFLCGFLPVIVAVSLLLGFSPLDSIRVAQQLGPQPAGLQVLRFFGLIAPFLLVLGAFPEAMLLRQWRTWFGEDRPAFWRFLLLIAYPLVLLGYGIWTAGEMRYYFPFLAPLIALHGGRGIASVVSAFSEGGWRKAAASLFVLGSAALFLAPPLLMQVREGPSSLTGHAWAPNAWRQWQDAQEQSFRRLDGLVARAGARPRSLIVSGQWNDEFYVRLRLFEAGYRPIGIESAYPGCSGFSVYRRGRSDVLHLRLWGQYERSPFSKPDTAALLLTAAGQCPAVAGLPEVELTTFGKTAAKYLERPEFEETLFPLPVALPAPAGAPERWLKSMLLGPGAAVAHMPLASVRKMSSSDFAAMVARSEDRLERSGPLTPSRRSDMLRRYWTAYRPLAAGSLAWSGRLLPSDAGGTPAPDAFHAATPAPS